MLSLRVQLDSIYTYNSAVQKDFYRSVRTKSMHHCQDLHFV